MNTKDILKKYKINKSTWTYKGFHGVLHTFFPVGQSGFPMKKIYGDGNTITLFFSSNDYVHWFWNDKDLDRIRNIFLQRIKKDKNYLKDLQKDWHKKILNFEKIIKKVDKTSLGTLNNKELSNLYDNFYKGYLEEFTYFMTLGDAVSMHADRYLIPEFKKILGDKFNEVFPKLIITKHKSFIEKEYGDRKKLIKYLRNNKSIPKKELEKHAAKYFYIHNNYAKGNYITAEEFNRIIQEDFKKDINNKSSDVNKVLDEQKKLIKQWKLSSWHKTLIDIMDDFFGIQDTRKKYVLIANYYQFEFLRQLEKRLNIPLDLLTYSVYPEFNDLLKKKLNVNDLRERKKMSICIQTLNSYEIITGETAKELLDVCRGNQENTNELKGTVVSGGKVTGIVKIILKIHDMINMDENDIMVASMTRPEMIPAMKKASAIITDEGGVTCHAAIVAREMKKPCIIGTKIATQVLQDGDRVEVDANHGIIKILK